MVSRSRARVTWRRAAVLAALAILSPQSNAFGQSSPGLNPGSRVELHLERGRFLDPLPFDVQFYLFGEAVPDLVSVRGRIGRLAKRVRDCAIALPPEFDDDGPELVPIVIPPTASTTTEKPQPPTMAPPAPEPRSSRTAPAVPIRRIPQTVPYMNGGKREFELSVDPLDPNTEYCFDFTLTYRADPAELVGLVAQALDTALRTQQTARLAELEAFEEFRRQVANAIVAAAKRKSVERGLTVRAFAVKGSFFDLNTRATDILLMFRNDFTRTMNTQANREATIRGSAEFIDLARRHADALLRDAQFKTLLRQVNANSNHPSLRLRLTGLEQALALPVNAPEEFIRDAPEGVTGGPSTFVDVRLAWTPADVAGRIQNLAARVVALEAIAGLADALSKSAELRAAAGVGEKTADPLTAEQLSKLSEQALAAADRFADVRDHFANLQMLFTEREAAIIRLAQQVSSEASKTVPFQGNTIADWETRAKQYISADVGLASSQPIDSTFLYVGTNVYLGPVNKKAPLPMSDWTFRKRFAFMVGIPLNPFDDNKQAPADQFANAPNTLQGVIGGRPLLAGAGLRLTDVVRFTGGVVMFRIQNANPLVSTRPERHYTWFLSLSTDWDLKGMFSGIGGKPPVAPQLRGVRK